MPETLYIIACGKIPGHRNTIPGLLRPEYEVLQEVFTTVEAFAAAFPTLMVHETKKPSVVVLGGGFDQTEFEQAQRVPWAAKLPFMRPLFRKPGGDPLPRMRQPASVEQIVTGLKAALDEHRDALEAGSGAGEVWYWKD